ncbi:MAG: amino acid adenylation domain-containing protein, partial [Pseudomonadota bacterium]
IAKARPGVESFRGARHRFELSEELSQDIRTLSRSENSTLFTTLLAGFIVLLHRFTGLADFAVGTTSANRHHPHMESLIGFFVNSLVLRADLAGNPTTREVLRRVNRVAIDAFEHSQVPFDFVVEALRPNRSSSHSPLFQVLFDFRGKSKQCPQLPGISIKIEDIAEVTTRLDLILSMEETVTGIKGYWQYNTDLFDPSAIARMSSHLETLLHAMVTDPSRPIGSLPLLTAEEHHQIVDQWNHTDASFDIEGGVVDWFLSQVDQNPDATAVVDSQRSVTYRELDSRASQIAHCLLDLGVKSNSLVGVYVDRSVEAIEAIFGALKAGAAYVPLDPAFPRERLRLVLEEIDVSAILTVEDRVIDNSVAGAPQLCLDSATIDSASTHSPELAFHPEHLAYVMFTSGSSGKPKGVAVTHANLQHSILARCEYYQEVPRAFLALSSFAFDSSVAGIFWTLTQGGKLVLSPVEAVVNVADIWERVEAHSITHTLLIPSLYQLLLADLPSRKSTSLQTVIVAGEQCPPRLVASHQKHLGATHLYNEYGPTEATVWSTVYKCDSPTTSRIPIGRPISNTRVYLLDTYKQPVPLGTPGELYIAGGGVASGYINDVVNTEEKFVQTDLEQSRLYRTGDLARYLSDGNIELIGRIDQQVQIRGYRIELGEIEAALKHHAGVHEAVATLCGEEDHQRLVAYVEVGTDVSEDSLYRHLQAKMPTYAWPQIIVREHLPRLPNGKIDRCALDEVPACDSTHAQEWTGLERAIAEVWQETLGIDSVKRDDNFFRIGGDSLSAIRVFNQIQAMTDSELAITDLFKHTTVSSLAEYLHKEVVIGEL